MPYHDTQCYASWRRVPLSVDWCMAVGGKRRRGNKTVLPSLVPKNKPSSIVHLAGCPVQKKTYTTFPAWHTSEPKRGSHARSSKTVGGSTHLLREQVGSEGSGMAGAVPAVLTAPPPPEPGRLNSTAPSCRTTGTGIADVHCDYGRAYPWGCFWKSRQTGSRTHPPIHPC